jgi:general L-amino acid transport system permease protein
MFIWIAGNTAGNLAKRSMAVGFEFLGRSARFPISESVLPYSPTDHFGWALLVGLGNTLFLSAIACVGATALGFLLALGRRSGNALLYGLSSGLVDVIRNTPLVVQLLFWYGLVTVSLPDVHKAIGLGDVVLCNRGLFLPAISIAGPTAAWLVGWAILAGGAIVLLSVRRDRRKSLLIGAAAMVLAVAVWIAGGERFGLDRPHLLAFNYDGGFRLTPEFAALFAGLLLYSSVFVCEIFRGGIAAIGKGQWEAGRALGLGERRTLWMIVLPQAMRIVIPPMTTQYLSIIKNTTLALVVGYPDISMVVATTINQTGQALEGVGILVTVFLGVSLAASIAMTVLNRRMAFASK